MNQGQPKGLYLLFFTELWERFGFYMVQTILVLYMTKGLFYSDDSAYLLYGAFSSMLYLTPVVGGYIADRFIGFRNSIFIGAFLLFIGYGFMAGADERFLFMGLSFVILGNGFFKPSVSSIVGDLYHREDPRRDGGFTLFYMGINLGSLFPPLFAGALVAAYHYSAGFWVAALGMLVSIATFLSGQKFLGAAGGVPSISPLHRSKRFKVSFYLFLWIAIALAIAVLHLLLFYPKESNLILVISSVVVMGTVLFYLIKELPEQRRKLIACLILIAISIGFWAVYNQTFTSLMLFADRNMSKDFLGFKVNAEFTQFFNPFFIVILSPILSRFWLKVNLSTPLKFSLGVLLMAVGFFTLGGGVFFFHTDGEVSLWWLVLSYFLQTVGELFISPIGLAMVTRLSPPHLVGMMMGVWFLTQSAAFAIGGALATVSDVPEGVSKMGSLEIYLHAFFMYGSIALLLAGISFLLIPFLNRLMTPKF